MENQALCTVLSCMGVRMSWRRFMYGEPSSVYSIELYGSQDVSRGEGQSGPENLSGHDFIWHQLLD